jgi:large subunit ribosomal protein L24e
MKTEVCNFSGGKVYPGRGKIYVRSDCKSFRLLNGKCASHFLTKKNPRKFNWTTFYRKLHKKGTAEELSKRKARRTQKVQRAVVGATWEEIMAMRNQPQAVRKATRDAATDAAKQKKRDGEAKRKAEKVKALASSQRQQTKTQPKSAAGSKAAKPTKSRF